MTHPGQRRPLVWRRQLTTVWFLLLPGFGSLFSTVRFLLQVRDGEPLDVGDLLAGWLGCIVVAGSLCLFVFVFVMIRGRVRLLDDAVEVQEFATRRYRYCDIAEVFVDRANYDRTIKMVFRDGRARSLPAPTRGMRKPSDTTLVDAVSAIRARLDPPGPGRLQT